MSKASILNQLRKLEVQLAEIHDAMNNKYGAAHEMTQKTMWAYARVFSVLSDAENLFDEQSLSEEDE